MNKKVLILACILVVCLCALCFAACKGGKYEMKDFIGKKGNATVRDISRFVL